MKALVARIILVVVFCVLAAIGGGSAVAGVMSENFNDNVRAEFWKTFSDSTTKAKEKNEKLRFKSTSAGSGIRSAGYESKGWTFRGDRSHTIEWDYCLEVEGMTGNDAAAVGINTIVTDNSSSLDVYVIQTEEGYTIQLELFVEGESVSRRREPIENSRGTVRVEYSESTDRISVFVDDDLKLTLNNLNGDLPPFNLDIQLLAWSSRVEFGFGDAWIDNFTLNGVIND